jgi:hypothetical protein
MIPSNELKELMLHYYESESVRYLLSHQDGVLFIGTDPSASREHKHKDKGEEKLLFHSSPPVAIQSFASPQNFINFIHYVFTRLPVLFGL